MSNLFRTIFLMVCGSLSIAATAQPSVTLGKVGIEDLMMRHYRMDSTAPAVVLYDVGYLNPNTFEFKRHIRSASPRRGLPI